MLHFDQIQDGVKFVVISVNLQERHTKFKTAKANQPQQI